MKTYLIYYPIFWVGYLLYKTTNKTFWYPYVSFRRLFVLTKGRSNDMMNERLKKSQPSYPITSAVGVLGNLGHNQIKEIVKSINGNGYHIFDVKLDEHKVKDLVAFAHQTEAIMIPAAQNGVIRSLYKPDKPLSPRYQFDERDVMKNSLIQELATDQTLFAVAQEYLGCKPIQDLTAMWWSTTFTKVASSEAAQLYHFDMDRFKFIKFFFYLTDVDSSNGPHCYIRGSHKYMPDSLWKDGRIQDSEIQQAFPKEDILEIAGPKGTIIAVDTRGLHKGKVLERGERLILQFEFTNSLFGVPFETIKLSDNVAPTTKRFFEDYRYSFQRFKL